MKRYFLFIGIEKYYCGGMDDFFGDFDAVEQAEARFKDLSYLTWHWYHIFDTVKKTKVKNVVNFKT